MATRDRDPRPLLDVSSALRSGVSALALCVLAISTPGYAQDTQSGATQPEEVEEEATEDQDPPEAGETETDAQEPAGDEIIVTGIRQSLQNAQSIKRNADTFVDAITAQDIGALPDRSVTEALQRVPGVSINRFAGSNDPDHFSVEGSGVVIRGLSFVRSEFNGRDTFHTGVYGQAINFADVPAELLGSIEVYKNSTAEMIEGGLSGTVNLNLRRPFDNKGFHLGYNAEIAYSDFADKRSPVGSLLVSNTWETGIGRLGLLGAASYSQVFSRADGLQITNFQTRDAGTAQQAFATNILCRNQLPADTDSMTLPPPGSPCGTPETQGADGFADLMPLAYAPVGGQFRTQDFNRKRKGFAAAAQWESLDRTAMVTASFLRSNARQNWGEHTFEAAPDLSEYNTYPVGCQQNGSGPGGSTRAECPVGGFTNYQYDEDGVFESGYITQPVGGWRGSPAGAGWGSQQVGDRVPYGGMQHSLARREVEDVNIVQDHGLNFKFTPNDRWAFNVDAQHVRARHDNLDVSVFGSLFADQELDLTGEYPVVVPHVPISRSPSWAAPTAEFAAVSDEQYFTDPRYTFWRAAMDHTERSRGKEWAFRGDAAYNFHEDAGILNRVKFGARYADRDQKVRYTTYNWGALSEVWSSNGAIFMDQVGGGNVERYDFNNFFRGEVPGPPSANYYAGDLIDNYDGSVAFFQSIQDAARAIGSGGAATWRPLAERAGVVEGTPFLPSDIQNVGERHGAGYAMLSFGDRGRLLGGAQIEGNIGLRYVTTRVASEGSIGVPSQEALGITEPFQFSDVNDVDNDGDTTEILGRCAPRIPPPPAPQVPVMPGGVCDLGPEGYARLQQWATGETTPDTARNDYNYFLPSLNVKVGLTDELILRFAGSRNLARAGMADIRNFLTVGSDASTGFRLTATAGNPYLKPAISDNLDLGLEWYFGRVGSLTLNGFFKNIHNFFYQDIRQQEITSNGITQTVSIRGPANFEGKGKIRGFELAYQQAYDFLPGILSGLGLSANYTHIKSRGLPNSQLAVADRASPIGNVGNLPLEQLSKHNVNVAGFYEKGPVSLRAAYNWRSKFLLTASDVIFPYFPIFNDATGQLDASAFYTIQERFKVGVQAVNLTNEVTKTLQQFTASGLLGDRSYFMNDRRFSFILRGNF